MNKMKSFFVFALLLISTQAYAFSINLSNLGQPAVQPWEYTTAMTQAKAEADKCQVIVDAVIAIPLDRAAGLNAVAPENFNLRKLASVSCDNATKILDALNSDISARGYDQFGSEVDPNAPPPTTP